VTLIVAALLVGKVPALGQLGVVAAVLAALVVVESVYYARDRAQLHHTGDQAS